jgi:hypothetical protein
MSQSSVFLDDQSEWPLILTLHFEGLISELEMLSLYFFKNGKESQYPTSVHLTLSKKDKVSITSISDSNFIYPLQIQNLIIYILSHC